MMQRKLTAVILLTLKCSNQETAKFVVSLWGFLQDYVDYYVTYGYHRGYANISHYLRTGCLGLYEVK